MIFDKHIFLLRHGETVLNAKHIRQNSTGELSDSGREQARRAGERLKSFKIKKMISSPFERTIETSNIVAGVLGLEYSLNDLLVERRNPSEIIGRSYEDPVTVQIINFIDKSFHDPNARYSDEENFTDMRYRAIALKKYLEEKAIDNTLCISHGIFLKMFLSVVLVGDNLSISDYIKLSVYNTSDNAAISLITYNPLKKFLGQNPWKILAYNDTSL